MHSAWNRANAVLTLSSTVVTAVFCFAAFLDILHRGSVHTHARVNKVGSLRQEPAMEIYYSRQIRRESADRVRMSIDLDVDLRNEFTWLTKQLFLYVTVEFETTKNRLNQAVIWSYIISDQEHAALQGRSLDELFPYVLNDQGFGMRGRPFNLTVSWNVMPYVGMLRTRSKTFTGFRFPTDYTAKLQMREVGERSASAAIKQAADITKDDETGEVLAAEAETGLFDDEYSEQSNPVQQQSRPSASGSNEVAANNQASNSKLNTADEL